MRGWGQAQPTEKPLTMFFSIIFNFILILNLFSVILRFFFRKTTILKGSRGVQHFPKEVGGGGGPTFYRESVGGSQMLISTETFKNL